ncbi:MAG: transposase [Bacteroidota bacterium]
MTAKEQRRHYSPEEKVKILREHLEKRRPVSEICEQYGIDPSQFSQWKKAFFEGGVATFSARSGRPGGFTAEQRKAQQSEAEIRRLQEVVSELASEVLSLKKRTGRS